MSRLYANQILLTIRFLETPESSFNRLFVHLKLPDIVRVLFGLSYGKTICNNLILNRTVFLEIFSQPISIASEKKIYHIFDLFIHNSF